jgi:HSP20 family molecular chaperone IbpA
MVTKKVESPADEARPAAEAASAAEPAGGRELEVQEKQELQAAEEQSHPGKHYVPYADIYETADSVYVVIEMPGVSRENLDITLDDNVLSVEGRIDVSNYASLRPVYTEYNVGHFSRSFRLPGTIDPDAINARVADGVLTLELGKHGGAKARRIPIQ